MRPGRRRPRGRLHALGAGQHGLAGRDNRSRCYDPLPPGCPRNKGAPGFGTRALRMLAEGLRTARLETRTKEYNMHASWWAATPRSASNLTGGMACACTINRP